MLVVALQHRADALEREQADQCAVGHVVGDPGHVDRAVVDGEGRVRQAVLRLESDGEGGAQAVGADLGDGDAAPRDEETTVDDLRAGGAYAGDVDAAAGLTGEQAAGHGAGATRCLEHEEVADVAAGGIEADDREAVDGIGARHRELLVEEVAVGVYGWRAVGGVDGRAAVEAHAGVGTGIGTGGIAVACRGEKRNRGCRERERAGVDHPGLQFLGFVEVARPENPPIGRGSRSARCGRCERV